MLELDDIRAGNQVLHNASGSIATILKVEDNKILLETFPQNIYVSGKDISGIPLTESLLKKLSFTNTEQNDTWSGEGLNIRAKDDGFFYGLRNFKSKAKMQYLHQLQNYVTDFYALFREKQHALDVSML
jgi:hypothetical protein